MEPQNQTQTQTTTATEPTTAAQTSGTQTSNTLIATPAGDNGGQQIGTIDLSLYFKDGEPGVFDADKITALVKERDNKAKSASYFQSQFMQKNEVPETIDGYAEHFKPDSTYEKFMDNPQVQETIKGIREMGLKEGLSPRAVNAFIDYSLKMAVADNELDARTPEEIVADAEKATAAEREKLTPFLESTHRTFEQQTDIINKFLNTPSVITNDPAIKSLVHTIANGSADGYKLIANIIDMLEFGGYKSLPTQAETLGVGATEFWSKYNAETDPVKREAMLTQYERGQPK